MMIEDNNQRDSGASNVENRKDASVRAVEKPAEVAPSTTSATASATESATPAATKTPRATTRRASTRTTTAVRAKAEKSEADAQPRLEMVAPAQSESSPSESATSNSPRETPQTAATQSSEAAIQSAPVEKRAASTRAVTDAENSATPMRNENDARDGNLNARSDNARSDASATSSTRYEASAADSEPKADASSNDNNVSSNDNAPRAVRLPEMRAERDERRPENRNDARNDNRGDRGLRFRGREGRAELRRNDTRGFRARFEGGANGGNRDNTNTNSNANSNANGNANRNARNENQGRLQNNRNDGNRNQNRDDGRDYPRDNRNLDRDLVRNSDDLDLTTLEDKPLNELRDIAGDLGIDATSLNKSDAILRVLEAQAENSGNLFKKGILEIMPDGKGFLRTEGYLSSNEDVYISQSQIKRFNLKTGDLVSGQVRAPKEMERYYGLLRVEVCNGEAPDLNRVRKEFEKLTPIFPNEKFNLETTQENITARVIDLVSPIGKGQRGLIVAPPKAGKTSLIKNIANSIMANHPDVHLIVLLIDERPEEVTDIARSVRGEVVASTFDEMPENHIRVADMVLEKAKRMVEQKKDVVILLDSITRLSRASNLVVAPSGRTMSGGLDPAAMYKPKRLFGAARNIEEGGSLTILATVLIDTGSRMDEYIFEELKGTGNMDLVLDRNLFDQRIFPAIDINKSGTRRDDLLLSKDDLTAVYHLRRTLSALDNDKAINLLIDRLRNTKTNGDFMAIVQKSSRQQNAPTPSPAP